MDRTGVKWTFRKAESKENDEETKFGFAGKTVIGKRDDAKKWSYAYEDGSPVAEDDLKALSDATDTKEKPGGEPSGEDIFCPKSPVKVGESWAADLALVAKSFGDDSTDIETDASKATCTLKKVETRGGAAYGIVEIDLLLAMKFKPPIQLEKSLPLTCKGELDACLDETQPDGSMKTTFELKGKSSGTVARKGKEPLAIELEMHSKGTMEKSRKSVK